MAMNIQGPNTMGPYPIGGTDQRSGRASQPQERDPATQTAAVRPHGRHGRVRNPAGQKTDVNVHDDAQPAQGRSRRRGPAVGTKVIVEWQELDVIVGHRGTVTRRDGSKVFVTYERKLHDIRELTGGLGGLRFVHGRCISDRSNLQIFHMPRKALRTDRMQLSAANLRRLARTAGLCADEGVRKLCIGIEASNLVLPAEVIDWRTKDRENVTIVSSGLSSSDNESDSDYDDNNAAGRNQNRGLPVNADDRVLQHMQKRGPYGRSAPESGPFVLFENVLALGAQDNGRAAENLAERPIPTKLGVQVVAFDSGEAGISQALRKRLYWTNIPLPADSNGMDIVQRPCPLLVGKPAFDSRLVLNALTMNEGTDVMNKVNAKLESQHERSLARGISEDPKLSQQEWHYIRQNNLLFFRAEQGSMWQIRMLKPEERCEIMGFPKRWVDGVSTTVAARMLGQSFHVPTIELLLSGLEDELRAAITAGLGNTKTPLVVMSFFDGIGAAFVALRNCLERWGLATVCLHYISIENDAKCRRVLRNNFPKPVKAEAGTSNRKMYHLHAYDASKSSRDWGDIQMAEKAIVTDGRHRKICNKTGASALLEKVFLVFNGFPCINAAGLNRAQGANGRQSSMEEGAAGPQTGLYYSSERILERILEWKGEAVAADHEEGEDDFFQVSDAPF